MAQLIPLWARGEDDGSLYQALFQLLQCSVAPYPLEQLDQAREQDQLERATLLLRVIVDSLGRGEDGGREDA